jgi:hypothetical protein
MKEGDYLLYPCGCVRYAILCNGKLELKGISACDKHEKEFLSEQDVYDFICGECGLVSADRWYRKAPGYSTPWCLLCIAAREIEQCHLSRKAALKVLEEVKQKYGYETYAGLEEILNEI